MIYLDNAATSGKKPQTVYDAVSDALINHCGNPGRAGHRLARSAGAIVENARMQCAALFGAAEAGEISFAYNCTDALNMAVHGVLKPGDHVITSCLEHNSVARPLEYLKSRGVIDLTVLPASVDTGVDPEDVRKAFKANTSLVAVTHVSNVTGTVNDVSQIGAVCRENGVRLLVDAAQSAGNMILDVQEMNIDILAFPGHKALFGPQGTGGLYVKKGIMLEPLKQGGTGSFSESLQQPQTVPDRYESGTLNVPGLSGLAAGIEFIRQNGIDNIHKKEKELSEKLLKGFSEIPGVTVYSPSAGMERGAVVSITLEGAEPQDIAMLLDSEFDIAVRAGLHCAAYTHRALGTDINGGTVRFSPGYFTTDDDVEKCIDAVMMIAREV
ncbi:MAG: aminotransferase class V-fold PLP-dependent enzyme [Clostridiales bacterium]|nr:aminotransferase class V-fold PLP-dependent enzyme [Clostridiales bacterium]